MAGIKYFIAWYLDTSFISRHNLFKMQIIQFLYTKIEYIMINANNASEGHVFSYLLISVCFV